MAMNKLLKSKKKIMKINDDPKKAKTPKQKQRKTFEEKYKRMTTYVRRPLHRKIQLLKESGKIRTITDFVNDAFKEYIESHY